MSLNYRNAIPVALAFVLLLMSGCASTVKVVNPKVSEPDKGKALVLFMRPKRMENFMGGGAIAKLYDGDTYLGELPVKTQMAYQANPGKHLFMVANGNADFLEANLKAGKTYYIVVEPVPTAAAILLSSNNMGFTMRPQNGQIDQAGLDKWFKVMRQVEPTEAGFKAAKKWDARRKKLKDAYYAKWTSKPKDKRPYLQADSGR